MHTKISKRGFSSIIFFISQSMFLGIGLTQILNSAENSSPFSVILGFFLGFLILYLFFKLFNYEKDLSIFEKFEKIFGKGLGNIINFLLLVLFLFYFIYILWSTEIYIQNKYLDKTPSFLILLLFLIPIVYSVNKDIKTIAKLSLIIFIITIIEIFLSVFGLTSILDINNLKPFFNKSFITILKNALCFISYFLTPIFLMLTVPKNKIEDSKNLDKSIIIFYIFGAVNFFFIFIFIIGVFGIDLAKLFYYPEFTLVKKINYFNFIEHVENILSTQWLFSLFMSAVMSLLFFKKYLEYKKVNNKILYYLVIFISLIISTNLFKNTTIGYHAVKNLYKLIYSIPLLLLTIVSIIIITLKKSKT